MNQLFSMLYSIIFLSAIIGSFAAINSIVSNWRDYSIFLIECNEFASSLELIDYFDENSANLTFKSDLGAIINDSGIFFNRSGFFMHYDLHANPDNAILESGNFILQKNGEGLGVLVP